MTDSDRLSALTPGCNGVVFAVDLGGTHLRAAAVDEKGKIHFRLKQNTPQTESPDEIVRAVVLAVDQCKQQCPNIGERIRAISIVVPGSVRVEQGIVVKAPNLPCLDGFQLPSVLTDLLELPAIL